MFNITRFGKNVIDIEKLLLILGVVLIHSDFSTDFDDISYIGEIVMLWGSKCVAGCCVPIFFMLSGFLFFKNVESFSATVYFSKLRSRVRSLLIPYLIWNMLAAALFIFKVKLLGFDGYDVIVDDCIRFVPFLRGFWDLNNGYPYDFAFWFIRRLMIFVVLSPVSWLIAVNRWIIFVLFAVLMVFNVDMYGLEYFALGAVFARHNLILHRYSGTVVLMLFLIVTVFMLSVMNIEWIIGRIVLIRNMLGALLLLSCSRSISRYGLLSGKIGKSIVNSTFMIYGIHSLYSTVVRKVLAEMIGVRSALGCLATYFFTWCVLVVSSWLIFLVLRRLMPNVLSVLTGGRIKYRHNFLSTDAI